MEVKEILEFLHQVEGLKKELRHSWLSSGRQEGVADHVWRVTLMAMLLAPKLDEKIDINKAVKMAAVHDISESFVGDVPAFLIEERKKQQKIEEESMIELKNKYNNPIIDEIYDLWQEFEKDKTLEAKFIKAIDRLEVRIQHNEAKMETWKDIEYIRSQYITDKFCQYDSFLKEFGEIIKEEAKNKILKESDKNIDDILKEAEKLKKNPNKNQRGGSSSIW